MKTKDILIGLAVILVLAGIAFGVAHLVQRNGEEGNKPEDARITEINKRLDRMAEEIKEKDEKLNILNTRFNKIVAALNEKREDIKTANERIDKIEERNDAIEQRITEKNEAIDKAIVAMQGVIRLINIEIDNIFNWIKERDNEIKPLPIEPKQQDITWVEVIF